MRRTAASRVAPAIAAAPSQFEYLNPWPTGRGRFLPQGAEQYLAERSALKTQNAEFLGSWIMNRAVKDTVHAQQAGRFVELVFDLRSLGDLDINWEIAREILGKWYIMPGMFAHGDLLLERSARHIPWRSNFCTSAERS